MILISFLTAANTGAAIIPLMTKHFADKIHSLSPLKIDKIKKSI